MNNICFACDKEAEFGFMYYEKELRPLVGDLATGHRYLTCKDHKKNAREELMRELTNLNIEPGKLFKRAGDYD